MGAQLPAAVNLPEPCDGRPASRPRTRAAGGWRPPQAPGRRPVSCSALLGGLHRSGLSTRQLRHTTTLDKTNEHASCDGHDGDNYRKHDSRLQPGLYDRRRRVIRVVVNPQGGSRWITCNVLFRVGGPLRTGRPRLQVLTPKEQTSAEVLNAADRVAVCDAGNVGRAATPPGPLDNL